MLNLYNPCYLGMPSFEFLVIYSDFVLKWIRPPPSPLNFSIFWLNLGHFLTFLAFKTLKLQAETPLPLTSVENRNK